MYEEEIKSLPLVLGAKELGAFLGIPQSSVYDLLHRRDFPTLHINSRLLVSRNNLLKWLQDHTDNSEGYSDPWKEA